MGTSPILSNGTPIDDLLEPRGVNDPIITDVGIEEAGTDISNLYYPLSSGGSSPGNLGIESNGTDIGQLFAAIGTLAPSVQAPNAPYSANHVTWYGQTASCSLRVDSDGDITRNGTFDQDDWVDNKSSLNGNDFEVIATKTSGDTPSGTLGSYLSLNTNHTWSFSVINGSKFCQLQVTIRQKSDNSNSVTFNMTLSATSNSGEPL